MSPSRRTPGAVRALALLTAVAVLLAGCGGIGDALRAHVSERYEVLARSGDNLEARTDASVDDVTAALVGEFPPNDRYDDPAEGTFLRYDDDFVAVRPEPDGSGTLVSVDDAETGSSRYVPIIGPLFLPGGRYGGPRRGGFGGFGDSLRGGGPGSGK